MKNIIYILSAVLFINCTEEYDLTNRGLNVEELPGYVAFNADGANINLPDVETDENGEDVELNIEIPTGNLSNITVVYNLSGTAVFDTDYTIKGASSSGGQITIEHRQSTDPEDAEADNADLVIELLQDNITDGEKIITVTLISASNEEGEISIGRGGTSLLTTANVIISDVD
jgi:hypothetical protein